MALPESYPSKGADWGTYTLLSGVLLSEVSPLQRRSTPPPGPHRPAPGRPPPALLPLMVVGAFIAACAFALMSAATAPPSGSPPAWTARWSGPIWGLPSGLLPAGPVVGNGDFGMTLQTNNRTGCFEFWLGINSFWGLPPSAENPIGALNPSAPYPARAPVGTLRLCVLDPDFRSAGANITAEQRFADGVITATYTTAANRSVTTRSLLHPVSKLLVTEVECGGFAPEEGLPSLQLESRTTTLWRNATAAAAAASTSAGSNASASTQWFTRVAIPSNTPAMAERQMRVAVATRVLGAPAAAQNCSAIVNASAAQKAGRPEGSVRVGVGCVVRGVPKLTLVTAAATQLDLSGSAADFSLDPLPPTLELLDRTVPSEVDAANSAYWRKYWGRASVSLPAQPNLERWWYVSAYMLSSVTRPSPSHFGGSSFPTLWGPWATDGWKPDAWGQSVPWGGSYIIDYNTEAVLYGACSSNQLEQLSAYEDLVTNFLPAARRGALSTAAWAAAQFASRNASLLQCVQQSSAAIHFPCGIGPFGMPSGGNGPSPGGDWELRWCGMFAAMPLIWKCKCSRSLCVFFQR
eukprot:COSAG04_NODE_1478_length_6574_cov_5.073359_2_plen_577_part_00